MKPIHKGILTLAALVGGVCISSATVTPYSWLRLGEGGTWFADSSGTSHPFNASFSSGCCCGAGGGGNAAALITATAVGGPLGGPSGPISTLSTRWGAYNCGNSGMWIEQNGTVPPPSAWSLPTNNWVMECWVLPQNDGRSGGGVADNGAGSWFMSTATGHFGGVRRGASLQTLYEAATDTVWIYAYANTPDNVQHQIGSPIGSDKTRWIHVAVVNDAGVFTFYTNGVASGAATNVDIGGRIENCVPYIGSGQDTGAPFDGYLDECRYSTFNPGAFVVSDLLTHPPGPSIVAQPQSTTVWAGGPASFRISTAYDTTTTYKWRRGGVDITTGGTSDQYVLDPAGLPDSGAQFDCVVRASSISITSAPPATLTVVTNDPAEVAVYRNAVQSEASLLAYFPVDNDTGATVTNVKDATHNGLLELNAAYDGRTNIAFGQRALYFRGNGEVQINNNPAFEFPSGNGTIEALVYLDPTATPTADQTIFCQAFDGSAANYYYIRAARFGDSLIYGNDAGNALSWLVPGGMMGKRTHVAVVIDHGTNVTAYVDGANLGTKVQTGFGSAVSASSYIGGTGPNTAANWLYGAVDELAIYGAALSQNTIQIHYSSYFYGTHTAAPNIVSQPGSKTLLAGSSPVLRAKAAGTLPLTYQWTSNGIAIPGATSLSVQLTQTTTNSSGLYSLYVTNAYGWTNTQPIELTFVAPPSPYSAAVAVDHPIAYWRLGETSGTIAVDSAGFNDATYYPTETLGVAPVILNETDRAVDFGSGGGRAQVANVPELNPAGPFSVEVWTTPHAGAGGVVLSSQNRNNSRGGYSIHANFFIAQYGIDIGAPNANVYRFASTTTPQAGVSAHLVYTYDGTNGAFYLNGTLQASGAVSPFVNNVVAPLTIGKRSDNAAPWNGVVDEVAFYDYALSQTRITNHWSFSWVAPAITANPVGVTNTEWSTISLTAAASGYPNTYQWYKGSTQLAAVANADGSAHYPNGVNSTTLTIAQIHPNDSGQYHIEANNGLGSAPSTAATVLITADTNPPVVTSVQALGTPNQYGTAPTPFVVKVVFSEHIDPVSGSLPANYVFNPSVVVDMVTVRGDAQAPTLGTDFETAFLQTKGLTPGQQYTLTVNGVNSQAQTPVPIVPKAVSFWAPPLQQGVLLWDYYYQVANGIVNLQSSTNYYPNYAPTTNSYTTAFDTTQITGGDLNNNPKFGALGDNYGCSLSGWITPAVSGDYTFFLSSDDASELQLSTDSNPAGAFQIAYQTGCCNPFTEPTNVPAPTYTSLPISLVANTPYFIRALQTEGGGGDYVKVAWRLAGDPTPAASLTPIPSTFLSSYVLLPPTFNSAVFSNGQLTISWTGYQTTLLQSTNVALPISEWTTAATTSPYQVTPAAGGPHMYYLLKQQ